MRVICLSCGYKVEMDRAYDDYEGEIRCIVCGSILAVKAEGGKLKSVRLVKAEQRPTARSV
jgi:ribosomal protein S27E